MPLPALVSAPPMPEMVPEKVVSLASPALSVAEPRVMLPAPAIERTVSLWLARFQVAPPVTVTAEPSAMTSAAPSAKVPALTVVAPV